MRKCANCKHGDTWTDPYYGKVTECRGRKVDPNGICQDHQYGGIVEMFALLFELMFGSVFTRQDMGKDI